MRYLRGCFIGCDVVLVVALVGAVLLVRWCARWGRTGATTAASAQPVTVHRAILG